MCEALSTLNTHRASTDTAEHDGVSEWGRQGNAAVCAEALWARFPSCGDVMFRFRDVGYGVLSGALSMHMAG